MRERYEPARIGPRAGARTPRSAAAVRGAAQDRVSRLQRSAGNRAVASAIRAAREGVRPGGPRRTLSRVLLNSGGTPLAGTAVDELAERHPGYTLEGTTITIAQAHAEPVPYIVREFRHGRITIEPYRESTPYRWQLPHAYMPTGTTMTPKQAGAGAANPYELKRRDMPASLTGQVSVMHPTGVTYHGAEDIQRGTGLADAGLHRTHHLSDSAIRQLIVNIAARGTWGHRAVAEWFNAVAGPGLGPTLYERFCKLAEKRDAAGLEVVAGDLSNNPWQVGLGRGEPNMQVSAYFDESRTASGIPSPVASLIAQFTTNLATHGAADASIVKAALSQLEHVETGEFLHSMTVSVQPGQSAYAAGGSPAPAPGPAAPGVAPAGAAPATIGLTQFLQLGRPERPPVPPGVHTSDSLSNYQRVSMLQLCEGPEARSLLEMVREGKTREFVDQLKGAVFQVEAGGKVSLVRPGS